MESTMYSTPSVETASRTPTRVLAPFGRLLVLGFTAGEIPSVKVNRLLLKNISVDGVAWGAAAPRSP